MYTVVAHIPTDCEAAERPGNETVSFSGIDATLKLSATGTTSFPRTLTDHGMGLSHSTTSGRPYLIEGSESLIFNQNETINSNASGESLDTARSRLVTYVESLGYTPVPGN